MTPERGQQLRFLRVGLLLQAVGGLLVIALTVPAFIDYQLHPLACTSTSWCLDFRGLPFELLAIFMGPVIAVLLILSWRWRGPRLWPLAVVALIDAAAIFLTLDATKDMLHNRIESIPPVAVVPPLLLLPALTTLALGINLVRPVRWRPLVAVSAASCVLLGAWMWFYNFPAA